MISVLAGILKQSKCRVQYEFILKVANKCMIIMITIAAAILRSYASPSGQVLTVRR